MLKTITIHIDDQPQEVTLGSAKKSDSIRRGELMFHATTLDVPEAMKQVAFFLHPTCVCAVREPASLREMSLEDFMNRVDEVDIDLWMAGAYECNPQWKSALEALAEVGSEEAEKKIGTPSDGSSESTETPETIQATSQILMN